MDSAPILIQLHAQTCMRHRYIDRCLECKQNETNLLRLCVASSTTVVVPAPPSMTMTIPLLLLFSSLLLLVCLHTWNQHVNFTRYNLRSLFCATGWGAHFHQRFGRRCCCRCYGPIVGAVVLFSFSSMLIRAHFYTRESWQTKRLQNRKIAILYKHMCVCAHWWRC